MRTILLSFFFILNLWAQERVVSLSPSITEIIYALDAGESLVATSSYSLYPQEATKLPIVGSYTNPHLEKILAYRPTLVVGQNFNRQTLQKLQHFHIKTEKLKLQTITSIQDSILLLGHALNKEAQAKELLLEINRAIKKIHQSTVPHSVMIVYGLKEDLRSGIYVAGKDIFFDDIIKLCGNTNVMSRDIAKQPVLNYENIIALNPEQIIILHSHATEPNVDISRALQNWYKLPTQASRKGAISIVDEDYLHIPSQRVALTIERLSREMNDRD